MIWQSIFMSMSLEEWLSIGRRKGWISEIVCATHDGVPSTEEEEEEWDLGYDPCQHVLRLWPDPPKQHRL